METVDLRDRIAQRAYEIYLFQGGEQGRELEHWLQAEQDVLYSISGSPTPAEAATATEEVAAPKKPGRKKAATKDTPVKPAAASRKKKKE